MDEMRKDWQDMSILTRIGMGVLYFSFVFLLGVPFIGARFISPDNAFGLAILGWMILFLVGYVIARLGVDEKYKP